MKFEGQVSHIDPFHPLRHVQKQPLLLLPVTDAALFEQFAALVHFRLQFGGTPSYAEEQLLQSSLALYREAQLLQVAPYHWLRHLHVQFGNSPVTFLAWLLQSSAEVQIRAQVG